MNDTDFIFDYGEKNKKKRKDIEQAYISYYNYISH